MIDVTNVALSAFLAFNQPIPNSREVVHYASIQAIHADGDSPCRTQKRPAAEDWREAAIDGHEVACNAMNGMFA